MTGDQFTALFLLLLALLVTLLFGFWTGLAGAFAGLQAVARGTPALFGAGLLLLANGTWAGLRQAMLALLGGAVLAALASLTGVLPGFAETRAANLIEAAWLGLLAALAWRDVAPRWILPALVATVATTLPGAYAVGLPATHVAAGVAAILVLLAAGVMLEMLALLLSGIARPARIVAALAGAAALARLAGELQ
jgi:hypothetical protein